MLDLACCDYSGSTNTGLVEDSDEHRHEFYDLFLRLQWKDEDGVSYITWEFAQSWLDLLESNYGLVSSRPLGL